MKSEAKIFVCILGIAVLLYVVNLVRTKKLKEKFALLWLVFATLLVIAPLSIEVVDKVAELVGVDYPPALLFVVGFIIFLLIFFQFSVSISRLNDQLKIIIQEIAILGSRISELEALSRKSNLPSKPQEKDGDGESRSAGP